MVDTERLQIWWDRHLACQHRLEACATLFILLFIFILSPASAEIRQETARKAVTAAEFADGVTLHDFVLTDQDGKVFHLKDYFGNKKPLLVSFIYTSCATVCPTITDSLLSSVKEAKKELGDNFNVLTIGFDVENDTPEMLKRYGSNFDNAFASIRFAAGDEESVRKLTRELGFFYEKADNGFEHINMVSVVSADGRIYKQVYTSKIGPEDIKKPLRELLTGRIPIETSPSLIDRFKQFCSSYDPVKGKYSLNYPAIISIFMQLAVMLTIAYFIVTPRLRTFLRRR